MGISGIICNVCSWSYRPKNSDETGVQIDMLIDRDDNVINVCEIKFSQDEFELTSDYERDIRHKVSVFQNKTGTRKGVAVTMITSYGLVKNQWANGIQNQLTMNDLFAD